MAHTLRRWGAAFALVSGTVIAAAGCAAAGPVTTGPGTGGPGTGGPGTGGPPVVVRDAANGHTVSVTVGERVEVVLGSDYWTVAGSSLSRVLRQDGPTRPLPRPSDCPRLPGLGCSPVRTDFTALAPGTAVITASRESCGEALRCRPSQQHFSLTVVVRAST